VGWISNSTYWTNKLIGIIKAAIDSGDKVYLTVGEA